jgi:hypothetical protein
MPFEASAQQIRWRLHLRSRLVDVYRMLSTDQGRTRFWAESAIGLDGAIAWQFPNGLATTTKVIGRLPPARFVVEYLGGSTATFELADDGAGGTDLTLSDAGVREADLAEVSAGWVSVLLALKAAVDHGVDLRSHDHWRTWDSGFVDN